MGDADREDFEGPFATLKSGSEGVDAFDMLAWPGDDCCVAVNVACRSTASVVKGGGGIRLSHWGYC